MRRDTQRQMFLFVFLTKKSSRLGGKIGFVGLPESKMCSACPKVKKKALYIYAQKIAKTL